MTVRRLPHPDPLDPGTALWSDRLWPVLAGALTAVGALGGAAEYGWVGMVLITAGLWLFISLVLFGALSESGLSATRAAKVGMVVTVVLVDLIGLLLLFPLGGWVAGAVAGATSPPVTNRLAGLLRRHRSSASGRHAGGARDQRVVDAAFTQIVAGLEEGSEG